MEEAKRYHSAIDFPPLGDDVMATLVIKNLPDELHAKLKAQAQRNHRSLTKEVVSLIEGALGDAPRSVSMPVPLRLKGGYRPQAAEIDAAISEGRDEAD